MMKLKIVFDLDGEETNIEFSEESFSRIWIQKKFLDVLNIFYKDKNDINV